MKCLVVSDLHYSLKQFDWVADASADFDLVVIAGDHIDISGSVEGQVQAAVVMKYFRRIRSRTQIVVCSGNHDLDSHSEAGEKYSKWIGKAKQLGIPTDGDTFQFEDTFFTICPWWDGPKSRDDVAAQLQRDAARRQGRWVWVYHSPPDASPLSVSGTRHYGDSDLNRWIEQHSPDIVLTGHIHESPFHQTGSWVDRLGSTWVFNAGRQPGPVPTHIVIDTAQRTASWFSIESAEKVQLDGALERQLLS